MADEMADETFLQRLGRERVIAILRSPDAGRFVDAARVLYDAGIRGIEVTLTTAGAVEAIGDVRSALPEDAWVGAGTVMTAAGISSSRPCVARVSTSGTPSVIPRRRPGC